jgi:hypothetical protein
MWCSDVALPRINLTRQENIRGKRGLINSGCVGLVRCTTSSVNNSHQDLRFTEYDYQVSPERVCTRHVRTGKSYNLHKWLDCKTIGGGSAGVAMSIQPYKGPGGSESSAGAIVPVGSAHELSEEEYAKRLEDVDPRSPLGIP